MLNVIEITSNQAGRRKNPKSSFTWERTEKKTEIERERWGAREPCELPKLKRLFIDFPASATTRFLMKKGSLRWRSLSQSQSPPPPEPVEVPVHVPVQPVGQSEAAAIVNIQIRVPTWLRVRTGTLERHKYPYPCPVPARTLPGPGHSKMFAQHNYRFGGLWEKYTSNELWDTSYKIQNTTLRGEEKEKVALAAIEPRPLQQRVESVVRETNKEWIEQHRSTGCGCDEELESMDRSMPLPLLIDKWNV